MINLLEPDRIRKSVILPDDHSLLSMIDFADKVACEAQSSTLKAVQLWGIEPCPHLPFKGYRKRECTICWNNLE